MNIIMLNAYLILTTALFTVAFCGSYSVPHKPTTTIIRAILVLLSTWSTALLIAGKP